MYDQLLFLSRWIATPLCGAAWAAFFYQIFTGDYEYVAPMLTIGVLFTALWVVGIPYLIQRLRSGW